MSIHKSITKKLIFTGKCKLCDSNSIEKYLTDITTWEHEGSFDLYKCIKCGVVFLNPHPSKKNISSYYPENDYWIVDENKDIKITRRKAFAPIYKIIYKNKLPRMTILDIGTGSGIFLTEFDKKWKIFGTELSNHAVGLAKKLFKLQIMEGEYTKIHFEKNSFGVVTLNNVLEHLFDPVETLEKIKTEMCHDGLLIITVPNINSLGFKIFNKKWHPLQPPRHLFHFSEESLKRLLEEKGFVLKGEIYNYWSQNKYSLFESFRFTFSPRFEKGKQGGLKNKKFKWIGMQNNLKKYLGIILAIIFTYTILIMEFLIKKPDVITIYATKE